MADEYWALGNNSDLWDTATLGESLTGITFSIDSIQHTYIKFTQFTRNGTRVLRVDSDDGTTFDIGSKPENGVFRYDKQWCRVITIHSIEPGSTAYEWIKSATGGKGVKYDLMVDLVSLNLYKYQDLNQGSEITTQITAKANGYAPNSNTATWYKE